MITEEGDLTILSEPRDPTGATPELHYRAVFDASPDAILIVDDTGSIVEANNMARVTFGYPLDELLGKPVEMLVPDSRRTTHQNQRETFQESPQTRPMGIGMELQGLRKDGMEIPVEVSLSPFSEDGSTYIVAAVRDISDRARQRAFRAARIRAVENERARIARDLHDDTAQRLAAAIIHLRLMGRAPDGRREELASDLRRELTSIAEGIRRMARGLRPPELEEVGLESAVQNWSRTLTHGGGLDVEIDADAVDARLSADQRLVLYRVVQEALTNVKRHSCATNALVSIKSEGRKIVARVRDNGMGFDPDLALDQVRGLGLHGMNERAAMIGARLRIESELTGGTEIRLEMEADTPEEAPA